MQKTLFVFSENHWLVPANLNFQNLFNALKPDEFTDIDASDSDHIAFEKDNGFHHHFVDLHNNPVDSAKYVKTSIREALYLIDEANFKYLAKAWQYAQFLRHHQFCGQCGARMQQVQWEMAMHCHKCHHRVYPRVSPCIIVAVRRDNKILLAQGVRHQSTGFFSTLAGFVESGESLEHAVHREIKEEVGIEVKNLEYFGSQAWPFPHSLMVGFLAEYAGGELVLEEKEILAADYFDIDALPKVPPKLSIAGRLIEETVKRIEKMHQN
uniref:NAD(+) diphosphatase n=1 Tax=Ningiella ruwaisensis TaxID=2364274 RepID=UPI00109EF93B|nr:NAD(+) diphosphatase [Ningiella ruwaisensis]